MTREEAIELLENHTQYFVPVQDLGALNMALTALRPVSREQVEKVWRGGVDCPTERAQRIYQKMFQVRFPHIGMVGC